MTQSTAMLLLNVLSSPSATLTEGQMLGALELSGIIHNPEALKAIQFAAELPSSSTPATVLGFAGTLKSIVKMHPEVKHEDYVKLEEYIAKNSAAGSDVPLTFGILLPFLSSLSVSQPEHPHGHGH
jgi:hypothetical protein